MAGELIKGLIGKEDMAVQVNTAATETFNRTASAGSTVAITKVPDIWNSTGKIAVATINAVTGNITDVVATTVKQGGNYVLEGDTTVGRVLRLGRLTIADATAASEIKCTFASLWNGDAIAETDNIGKGETVGNFTLDAAGTVLKIEAAGLSTSCVAVLSAQIVRNASNITHPFCDGIASTNDIQLTFRQSQEISVLDLTSMVDTGQVDIIIAYITSA